jgi:hypothetical protein
MRGQRSTEVWSAPGQPVDALDAIACRLNEICRAGTLDLAFRLGELIIREMFDNDPGQWGVIGARHPSYRALASRGDLALSASALCRAVGVYVLVEQLGGRARWEHLTASHFQEVLALPAEPRRALLAEAEEHRWSVARLRNEASRLRRPRNEGGSRAPIRSIQRLAVSLARQRDVLSQMSATELCCTSLTEIGAALQVLRDELDSMERLTRDAQRHHEVRSKSDIRELRPSEAAGVAPDSRRHLEAHPK